MKITLMYNDKAGFDHLSGEELNAVLKAQGFETQMCNSKEKGYERFLENPGDLILISGGDGTVARIVDKIYPRTTPVSLLPMGTANNIASSLGVTTNIHQLVQGLKTPQIKTFDVGWVVGNQVHKMFLESVGIGLFANTLKAYKTKEGKSIFSSRKEKLIANKLMLKDALQHFEGVEARVVIDGKDYTGKYLLAEVMNIKSIGPGLSLAPSANPGDGFFDVVLIKDHEKKFLTSYLDKEISEQESQSAFTTIRAKEVELFSADQCFHSDDEFYDFEGFPIQIKIHDHALRMALP
jgi:diacylglycerol kinase (ATP)